MILLFNIVAGFPQGPLTYYGGFCMDAVTICRGNSLHTVERIWMTWCRCRTRFAFSSLWEKN